MSDNPFTDEDSDEVSEIASWLSQLSSPSDKPRKVKFTDDPIVCDTWEHPSEENKVSGKDRLLSAWTIERSGDFPLRVTVGVTRVTALNEVYITFMIDSKLVFSMTICPHGKFKLTPLQSEGKIVFLGG